MLEGGLVPRRHSTPASHMARVALTAECRYRCRGQVGQSINDRSRTVLSAREKMIGANVEVVT